MKKDKSVKKFQANIDQELFDDVEEILNVLGWSKTTLINSLYSRIRATGGIPFSLHLTEKEKMDLIKNDLNYNSNEQAHTEQF